MCPGIVDASGCPHMAGRRCFIAGQAIGSFEFDQSITHINREMLHVRQRIAAASEAEIQGVDIAGAGDVQRLPVERSEERRGGKECVSTCISRWSPYH